MRLPALFAAATLTLVAAAPAVAAESTVERVLEDVSVTHQSANLALAAAGEDEEAIRGILSEWRDALIKAADDLKAERKEAEDTPGGLTKAQRKEFDEAAEKIEAERAEVRQLRAELLPEEDTVVIPAPLKGLGGLWDTTAADLIERQQGDVRIVYGIPGGDETAAETATATGPATVTATAPVAPTAPTSVLLRAERMQDDATTSTTTDASSTTTTTDATTTSATSTTTTAATTTAETTTGATTTSSSATTSLTAEVMQNRTTSATSTTSSSSTTSSTTRSSSSTSATVVIEEDDDDEREDDLADTGTPMRGLIILGLIAAIAGAVLVRRPA